MTQWKVSLEIPWCDRANKGYCKQGYQDDNGIDHETGKCTYIDICKKVSKFLKALPDEKET
jgi:hypothetical protein